MESEFEAKFYPVDKDKYREKLKSIGAKLIVPERKMRRGIADKRANPGINCSYIRVRDEGDVVRFSAKVDGKEGGEVGEQKETDVIVSDYDKTIQILKVSGLVFNRYQETLRETWEYEDAEITIDTWPGLLPYSEIETVSESRVKEIAEKLGLSWGKKILTPAPDILAKVYKLSIDDVLEKVVDITFENNPFKDLEMVWFND